MYKEKYGLLTVIEDLGLIKSADQNNHMIKCICDCGKTRNVMRYRLLNGHTKSCGCLLEKHRRSFHIASPRKIHGFYNHELFHIWDGMMNRCYDKRTKAYISYGRRGISVCDRWKNDFMEFVKDMGKRPSMDHSIERKNNDGNYEPGNCIWGTDQMQANNRRTTHYVDLNGNLMSMANACRVLKLKYKIINQRIKRDGLSFEEAISIPIKSISRV